MYREWTPILLAVVASSAPGVVASVHLLVEAGSMVAAVVLVAEATRAAGVASRVRPVWTEAFRINRKVVARCSGGAPMPSRGRALGPSDRDIFQEILELSLDTPPLGGGC